MEAWPEAVDVVLASGQISMFGRIMMEKFDGRRRKRGRVKGRE